MSQQLSRQLYFVAEKAVSLGAGQTEGMSYNGLQAKDDGKRVGESWLIVEGILSGLRNASGKFRKNEIV